MTIAQGAIGADKVTGLLPHGQRPIRKSSKLDDVCYDIRGPVVAEAHRLESTS